MISHDVAKIYVGPVNVKGVYLGANKVWAEDKGGNFLLIQIETQVDSESPVLGPLQATMDLPNLLVDVQLIINIHAFIDLSQTVMELPTILISTMVE